MRLVYRFSIFLLLAFSAIAQTTIAPTVTLSTNDDPTKVSLGGTYKGSATNHQYTATACSSGSQVRYTMDGLGTTPCASFAAGVPQTMIFKPGDITGITNSGNTATYTFEDGHILSEKTLLTVTGAITTTGSNFNVTNCPVHVISKTQVSCTLSVAPSGVYNGVGTALANNGLTITFSNPNYTSGKYWTATVTNSGTSESTTFFAPGNGAQQQSVQAFLRNLGTYDASYITFTAAVDAAGNGGLFVTKTPTDIPASINAQLIWIGSGPVLQPSGVVALAACPYAGSFQIFDEVTNGGKVLLPSNCTINSHWYGAVGNGVHDDVSAVESCAYAAWMASSTCYNPSGNYKFSRKMNFPPEGTFSRILRFKGDGQVADLAAQAPLTGTVFLCPSVVDCMGVIAQNGQNHYEFSDFTLFGPDMGKTCGTGTSGNGLIITNAPTSSNPIVKIKNVSAYYFYGTNKWSVYLHGPENSTVESLRIAYGSGGIYLSGAFNANVITNVDVSGMCGADAGLLEGVANLTLNGGAFQNNQYNGIRFHGVNGLVWNGGYFEQNNTTNTSGKGAIVMASSTDIYNAHIVLNNTYRAGLYDRIIGTNDGGGNNSYVQMNAGYGSGVSNPKVIIDNRANGWDLLNVVGSCSEVTDSGYYNTVTFRTDHYNCTAGAPLAFDYGERDMVIPSESTALKIGSTSSYMYLKPYYDGGGVGATLGTVFQSGSPVDMLKFDGKTPWMQVLGGFQLNSASYPLPTTGNQASNGVIYYCNNCTVSSTCAGGGSGAIAKRINNTWVCN